MNETDTNHLNESIEDIEDNLDDISSTEDRELSEEESVELDVLETYNDLKEGKEDGDGEGSAPASAAPQEEAPPKQEGEAGEEEPEEELKPPSSWKAEEKEWFNKQPKEAQQALARRATDLDRAVNDTLQERAELREVIDKRYGALDHALEPYREKWHRKGISEDNAIRALAAGEAYLEKDLVGGLQWIAQSYGTTIQEVANALDMGEGEVPSNNQVIQNAPQNQGYLQQLTEQVQLLSSKVQQYEQKEGQQSQQAELVELHAVRDEQDATGRYLRPEMHDEAFATETLIPEYKRVRSFYPDMSPTKAMQRAYTVVTGKTPVQNNVAQPQTTRRPSNASVRGTAMSAPREATVEVPDGVEDTMLQIAKESGLL